MTTCELVTCFWAPPQPFATRHSPQPGSCAVYSTSFAGLCCIFATRDNVYRYRYLLCSSMWTDVCTTRVTVYSPLMMHLIGRRAIGVSFKPLILTYLVPWYIGFCWENQDTTKASVSYSPSLMVRFSNMRSNQPWHTGGLDDASPAAHMYHTAFRFL